MAAERSERGALRTGPRRRGRFRICGLRGFKKLDAVALTDARQHHIGGLTAVRQNFRVSQLLLGRETAAPAFAKLSRPAYPCRTHERRTGSFLRDGVQLDVLWPGMAPAKVAPLAKTTRSSSA